MIRSSAVIIFSKMAKPSICFHIPGQKRGNPTEFNALLLPYKEEYGKIEKGCKFDRGKVVDEATDAVLKGYNVKIYSVYW